MAAATLRESMPSCIGMIARRSADSSQRRESPCPSEPRTRATRSSPATASSTGVESGASVRATVVKPCADSDGSASCQSGSRVQGSAKTAPMETLTARR